MGVDLEITTDGKGRGMTNRVAKLYDRMDAKEHTSASLAAMTWNSNGSTRPLHNEPSGGCIISTECKRFGTSLRRCGLNNSQRWRICGTLKRGWRGSRTRPKPTANRPTR